MNGKDSGDMGNHTQVDETYIGGKEGNKHADKRLNAGRGAVGKVAVVGIRDQRGQVRAMPVKHTNATTLVGFIKDNAPEGATAVTDEFKAYRSLSRHGFDHKMVRHSAGEYVRNMAHTNGIESFWSLLKRGYIGVYHYMSEKHLHRYVDEFSHRHNTSKIGTMTFIGGAIDKIQGKRLTYGELIADAK